MARKLITQFLGSVFGRVSAKQPASQVTTTVEHRRGLVIERTETTKQQNARATTFNPPNRVTFVTTDPDLPLEDVATALEGALQEDARQTRAAEFSSSYTVEIDINGEAVGVPDIFLSLEDAKNESLDDIEVAARRRATALHALSELFEVYPVMTASLPNGIANECVTPEQLNYILCDPAASERVGRALAVMSSEAFKPTALGALFHVALDGMDFISDPEPDSREVIERCDALLDGDLCTVVFRMPDGSDLVEAARAPANPDYLDLGVPDGLGNPIVMDARGATLTSLMSAGLLPGRDGLGVDPTGGMRHEDDPDGNRDEALVIKVRDREGAAVPDHLDALAAWAFRLAVAIHVFDGVSSLKDTVPLPSDRDLSVHLGLLRYKTKREYACRVMRAAAAGEFPRNVFDGWFELCSQAIETIEGLDGLSSDETAIVMRVADNLLQTRMKRIVFEYGTRAFHPESPRISEPIEEAAQDSKTARAQYAELYHRVIGNSAGKMRVEPLPSVRNGVIVLPHLNDSESRRKKDVLDQWKPLVGATLPLVPTPDLANACRRMDEEFPHAAQLTRKILREVGRADTVRFKPILLTGKPGIAKSTYARKLAEFLGLPSMLISCGGTADGSFGGTSAQWSTARASLPLQTIKEKHCANPMLILDEVEKASQDGHNGTLVDALLAYLEPSTANALMDPALESQVDVSRCLYIATANYPDRIPGPLYSRFQVLEMPSPKREHAPQLAKCLLRSIAEDRGMPEEAVEPLTIEEIEWICANWKGGNIRHLRRWVEGALDARDDVLASRPLH